MIGEDVQGMRGMGVHMLLPSTATPTYCVYGWHLHHVAGWESGVVSR